LSTKRLHSILTNQSKNQRISAELKTISLEYFPSLQAHYQKLSHLPGFALLESTDRLRGRYDILSAYPYDLIQLEANDQNTSSVLKNLSTTLSAQPSVSDLPFQGGALGYIAYDLGAQLLGIDSKIQPSLQGMPSLDLGLYDWAIIVDHHQQTNTLFAANTEPNTPQIIEEILELWANSREPCDDAVVTRDF
jgi:para-aminobenzoate synthetase component 1